jgi:hypothetical protein
MIIDSDEACDRGFAVVPDRTLLLNEGEAVSFKELNELVEPHLGCRDDDGTRRAEKTRGRTTSATPHQPHHDQDVSDRRAG